MSYSYLYIYINLIFFVLASWLRVIDSFRTALGVLLSFTTVLFLFHKHTLSNNTKKSISIVISIFVLCLLSALLYPEGFGIGSYFILAYFLIQFLFIDYIALSDSQFVKIGRLSLFLLLLYAILPNKDVNLNTIGVSASFLGMISSLHLKNSSKRSLILCTLLVLLVSTILLISQSRTAIGAFLLYFCLRFIPYKFFEKKYVFYSICFLMTVGSLIYVYLYVYMWDNAFDTTELDQFFREQNNKTLFSGREGIWYDVHERLIYHPITGLGSHMSFLSTEEVNLHNSIFDIFAVYGFIVGSLCICLILRTFSKIRFFLFDDYVKNCFCGVILSMIIGFNETFCVINPAVAFMPLLLAYARIRTIITPNKLQYVK